jgi:hypothetical protein
MIASDAFTVERHALRITQPITVFADDEIQIDCSLQGVGRKFGRIDFSKGFSQWWFLSHIDFHTPSEHTQEGKRYDGEIQLHHFYSATALEAGVENEMATVSIFMESFDDAAPYLYLDKIICLWRRHEHSVRRECGLDPVPGSYPGCFSMNRKLKRHVDTPRRPKQKFQTVQDIILYNSKHKGKNTTQMPNLHMDDVNWSPPEDKDWDAWIAHESAKLQTEDTTYYDITKETATYNSTTDADVAAHESFRKLLEGDEIEWFNYFPMLGVRTEYYYRYSGSGTIPPCYGNFQENSRKGTNHWRVLKDPIRIHPRQLKELQRLLKDRIAPTDDPVNPCQPDTAARVKNDGTVDAARPVQYHHPAHFKVFCECQDWPSKWPEDRAWCKIEDLTERFYDHPYNFDTNGF